MSRLSLALLAHVSSPLKSLLLPTEEQEGESATGWLLTPLQPLELSLPDLPPLQVRPDSLLPLLASLLQDSPDRRVRVAAAELLHVLTVVMVGKSATQTQEAANKSPLEPLFARLLPLLLKFSCDADTVLQSLFSPLLTQLCHWWSRPSRTENTFSSVLVEMLIEGVTRKEAAQREKAASLLEEFLTWGVRQGGGVQQAKALLARLSFLWRHPDHTKRLAASTVFNCVYRVLREHKDLVSVFLLEALVSVLASLQFAGQRTDEVEEAAFLSLKHMQRILVHHRSLFLVEAKDRRNPSELEGGSLKHLQLHLLSLSRMPHTCMRHKAMELLFVLHRYSPLDWKVGLEGHYGGGETFLRQLVENQPGLQKAEPSSLTTLEAVTWLEGLQAVLECVSMVVSEKIIPTCAIFSGIGEKLSLLSKELIDRVVVKEEDGLPKDLDKLRNAKCTALIRLFALLTAFLNSGDVALQKIVQTLDRSLVQVILMSVLEPSQIGFKLKTKEARKDFQACCASLLQAIANHLPHLKEKLTESLSQDYTQSDFFSPEAIANADRLGPVEEEVILGYLQLQRQGLFTISCSPNHLWKSIKSRMMVKKERKAQSKCLLLLVELVVACCCKEENQIWEEFKKLALGDDSQSKRLLHLCRCPLAPLFLDRVGPLLSESLDRPQKHHFLNLCKLMLKMGEIEGRAVEVGAIVREVTLAHWLDLVECGGLETASSETWLLQLVRHLILISDLGDNWEKGKEVVRWWCDSLSSKSLRLKVKFRLLALLPGVSKLAGLAGEHLVRVALLRLADTGFPAVSGELKEGSLELAEYTSIWRLLLSSLEATAYPPIFYLLLSVACREDEHCLEEEYQAINLASLFGYFLPFFCRLRCSPQFHWLVQTTSVVFLTPLGESWSTTLETSLLGSNSP